MSIRRLVPIVALVLALLATAAQAQTLIILNNLPGTPSGGGTNLGLGTDAVNRQKGVGFTTGSEPLRLLSATALLSNPTPSSVLSASLHVDAGGNPGAVLFEFDDTPVPENLTPTEVAVTPVSGAAVLDPDTRYWLVFKGPATTQSLLWQSLSPNAPPVADGVAFEGYRFSADGGGSWGNSTVFNGVTVRAEVAGGPGEVLRVAMPDSSNNRMVLFDPENGALVDGDWFPLQAGTPIHVVQIGEELWVSEQVGDRVARFDLDGAFLGQIGGGTGGGLDNLRGMAIVGDEVWLTNSGTANGAPGAALVRISLTGTVLGSISMAASSSSPFAILVREDDVLVANSNANDDIHRYDDAGASLGTFHNTTSLNFAQQMAIAINGDVLAAGFSSNNVVRLDSGTGALLSSFAASGSRGVYQLGNGNILWSNGSGVHVYDVASQTSTQVYTGGGRHFGEVLLPLVEDDTLFANGFECAPGLPDCPT
ncbi:MAG: hypothetical protein KF823_11795 [Xanthomonadales bacterium]|nr:hypothetical protein [Xanthomonadales bacterium]